MKDKTLKIYTYRLFREWLEEEIRGYGPTPLLRNIAETYCVAHDYSFELCNRLLDRYYKNEAFDIHERALKHKPYKHLLDQVLIDIDAKLMLAAIDGQTYFNNRLLDKNEPKGIDENDKIKGGSQQ